MSSATGKDEPALPVRRFDAFKGERRLSEELMQRGFGSQLDFIHLGDGSDDVRELRHAKSLGKFRSGDEDDEVNLRSLENDRSRWSTKIRGETGSVQELPRLSRSSSKKVKFKSSVRYSRLQPVDIPTEINNEVTLEDILRDMQESEAVRIDKKFPYLDVHNEKVDSPVARLRSKLTLSVGNIMPMSPKGAKFLAASNERTDSPISSTLTNSKSPRVFVSFTSPRKKKPDEVKDNSSTFPQKDKIDKSKGVRKSDVGESPCKDKFNLGDLAPSSPLKSKSEVINSSTSSQHDIKFDPGNLSALSPRNSKGNIPPSSSHRGNLPPFSSSNSKFEEGKLSTLSPRNSKLNSGES